MPQNWRTYKLGGLVSHTKGFAFKSQWYQDTGRLVVRISDTTDNTVDVKTCRRIEENLACQHGQVELRHKDIVITTVGSWPPNLSSIVGKVIRIPREADGGLLNQNAVRIRPSDEELEQDYLYYLLCTPSFQNYIIHTAQGSANQASIKLTDIFGYQILLPPLPEQQSIASFLSALDDKIELNLATNRTLERMAMALYKHWFVDFGPFQQGNFIESELGPIPEGWEVKRLDDISSKIGSGSTPRGGSSVYVEEGASLIRSQNVHDFNLPWDGLVRINEEAQKKLKGVKVLADDVLLNITGDSIMRTTIVDSGVLPAFVNQHVAIIRPANKNYRGIIHLYLLFKKEWLMNQTTGGTRKAITKSQIAAIPIAVPNSETLKAQFHQQIEPIYQQINANWIENRTITTLRDTLLPKLISGAIRVKDAERTVAHAL